MVKQLISRANSIRQDNGISPLLRRTIRFGYNKSIRNFIPSKEYNHWNDVKYDEKKYFDDLMPWDYPSDKPNYEEALISALRCQVVSDDHVGIIGGGMGISTVIASKKTNNKVTVYEASAYRISRIHKTIKLNNVQDIVDVRHALVGPDVRVQGEMGNPEMISPQNIPEFDVLEMDCEGAEIEILKNIDQKPRVIIVETHGKFGSPKESVIRELINLDYKIIGQDVEKEEWGIFILTAKRRG